MKNKQTKSGVSQSIELMGVRQTESRTLQYKAYSLVPIYLYSCDRIHELKPNELAFIRAKKL
jgi:hypothetical protein